MIILMSYLIVWWSSRILFWKYSFFMITIEFVILDETGLFIEIAKSLLWKPYPSYYNGLFWPLLVQRFRCQKGRSLSVLYEQYETYFFFVTLSFLCNIICYLISVFVFSLVTLSGVTTIPETNACENICFMLSLFCTCEIFISVAYYWKLLIILGEFSDVRVWIILFLHQIPYSFVLLAWFYMNIPNSSGWVYRTLA